MIVMSYFDRAQNRKDWEKMMVGLREERDRRAGGAEPVKVARSRDKEYTREPVPFKQVMAEYQAEQGIKTRAPARTFDKNAPQLSAGKVK